MIKTRTTITAKEISSLDASDNIPAGSRYLVIGNNGHCPCVWGAGETIEAAEKDAEEWLGEAGTSLSSEETETLEIV